jgi:flavocytochrome c
LHPSVAEPIKQHRERLISALTDRSASAIDFLVDLGVDLSVVAQLGGHSKPRTHRAAGKTPPGAAIVTTLLAKLKEQGDRFELVTEAEVTKLLTTNPSSFPAAVHVTGVEYHTTAAPSHNPTSNTTTHTIQVHGPVIFTTGGFAGDTHGLLARHRPDLTGLPSTNDPRLGAHDLLSAVGAKLVDMDSVQVHPTGFIDPANPQAPVKFLAAEMLRGEGGVLLYKGRRVVNELGTREVVSSAIMVLPPADQNDDNKREGGGSCGPRQWDMQLLLDPGTTAAAAGHVGFYLWKGLMQRKKVRELDEVTRETLREYAAVVRGEKQDEFGRTAFGHWTLGAEGGEIDDDAEVCIGRVTPIVHFTMGGAVFNEKALVLSSEIGEEEKPIQGLWAAGEITGGIHGDNRLGGSSLLECVVFGRIAGEQASQAALKAEA